MSIQIGNYNFEGPHESTNQLRDVSGVYAILGRSDSANGRWSVVDVGESSSVRTRVANHDRQPCWRSRRHAHLAVATLYVPELARMKVERELRTQFQPPCGDR